MTDYENIINMINHASANLKIVYQEPQYIEVTCNACYGHENISFYFDINGKLNNMD